VHYGKSKEEVEKFLRDKAAYEKDLAEATNACDQEKYEAGMRKEGVASGELHKDGRVVFKSDRGMYVFLLYFPNPHTLFPQQD
jgi:hypothetical protein|tara:strand:- start:2387 stop:2635 length:249 start_codon:yes stop_codon:yes gene_type:complete